MNWIRGLLFVIIASCLLLFVSLRSGRLFKHNLLEDLSQAYITSQYGKVIGLAYPMAFAGNPIAPYYLGLVYENGQGVSPEPVTALQWFQRAADRGYMGAWISLGQLYEMGVGNPQDFHKALACYEKASKAGVPGANGLIGVMYEFGRGIPVSHPQAMQWILKEQGQRVPAYFMRIGRIYEKGQWTKPDVVEAFKWYKIVGTYKNFQPNAHQALERLRFKMTPAEIAEGQKRVAEYLKSHPANGKALARAPR